MKHIYKYLVFLLLPFLANCSDNENWTIVTDVQPGTYITGSATMYSGEAPASALKVFPLDGNADGLSELVGIYTWLKADGDFSISIATDLNQVVKYGKGDEVKVANNISVYTLVQDASPFTVNEDGFYFIVVNTSLKEINILPVNYGIIGAATAQGWNAETPFDAPTFDGKLTVTWEGTVNLTAGEYKFRYGGDWGNYVNVSDGTTARLFTDLGNIGTSAAPLIENSLSQIKPGGANFTTSFGGQFKFSIQYDLRSRTFNATYVLIGGPVIPPTYPENIYLVGDATAYGWDTPGSHAAAEMHKLAGGGDNIGIYWKILYLEGGKGFKVSNANWSDPNLGFGEITEFDANGVAVSNNGGNMSIEESGMYTIVLDLRNSAKKLSVVQAAVYGIGDAFGGWDKDVAANKFTADNAAKTLVSPPLKANGNIRMYVSHPWIPDWWNAEFNVFGTDIIYRNDGGDQASVAGTVGQVITLHFDDNKGSIN